MSRNESPKNQLCCPVPAMPSSYALVNRASCVSLVKTTAKTYRYRVLLSASTASSIEPDVSSSGICRIVRSGARRPAARRRPSTYAFPKASLTLMTARCLTSRTRLTKMTIGTAVPASLGSVLAKSGYCDLSSRSSDVDAPDTWGYPNSPVTRDVGTETALLYDPMKAHGLLSEGDAGSL